MWKKYESMIKSIYDSVSKHNMTLIIKKHPDMAETDFSPELYSYLSSAQIVKNDELSNLLIDAKIVLSLGISSGILVPLFRSSSKSQICSSNLNISFSSTWKG